MIVRVKRLGEKNGATLGAVYLDDDLFCFSLEDRYQAVKVAGQTRIPKGVYELGINKMDTPLTLKYREKYPWFEYHLHIKNVPNFENVYIHVGNYHTDSDGCILLGDKANIAGMIETSKGAFQRFYKIVYPLASDGKCKIIIE